MREFKSTHNLEFLSAHWNNPLNTDGWQVFKIGTCGGQWRSSWPNCYEILTIINDNPGNGHLDDVLEWFEYSCKRDKYSLKILEVWNKGFAKHLIEKRGFTKEKGDNLIKIF